MKGGQKLDIKHQYNITSFHNLRVNYWGIPKCANTTMKFVLLRADDPQLFRRHNRGNEKDESFGKWAHHKCRYITPEQAKRNGFKNFTVVREPVDRFQSMYNTKDRLYKTVMQEGTMKGIKAFYDNPTVLAFLDFLEQNPDRVRNYHFRSQSSWCLIDNTVKLDMATLSNTLQQIHPSLRADVKLNTSPHKHDYDDNVINRIHEVFKEDFVLWIETQK